MRSNRIGKVSVNRKLLDEEWAHGLFYKIKFVPMRAEMMAHTGEVEYYGTSPEFDELPIGVPIPSYDLELDVEDDEVVEVWVTKVK